MGSVIGLSSGTITLGVAASVKCALFTVRCYLCCQSIGVDPVYDPLDVKPDGQICKYFHNTTVVGERRVLQYRQILHQTIVDDIFHDLVHEVDLITALSTAAVMPLPTAPA